MTSWKVAAVLAVLTAGAMPACANEAINGRWAVDASACSYFGAKPEQSPLIVSDYAVRWHDDACRIARMYKTGDTVHIQALCWSFAGKRSIPVSLRPHGGLLSVTWDRARHGELRRCR
jgi:hypothetical protein